MSRPGVLVAVDVGTVRVGVAASDPDRLLAFPVTTLQRDAGGADLHALAALVAEREAVEVVVGLPVSMSGAAASASAQMARGYVEALEPLVAPVPVRLVDERLTTVTAAASLRAAGRTTRTARAVVDQAAAVALLQGVLDARPGATGRNPFL